MMLRTYSAAGRMRLVTISTCYHSRSKTYFMSHLDRHSQSMNLQWSLVSFGLPHRSTCVLLFTTSNLDHVFWFTTSKLVHILEFGLKSVTTIWQDDIDGMDAFHDDIDATIFCNDTYM